MSDLVVKSKREPDTDASVVKVTPKSAGWEYVGFEVLKLSAGESVERRAEGEEVCLVPLSGTCSVSAASEEWEIGGRTGPFDGPPHALYLPPGTDYRVEATAELELAVCSAPAETGVEAFVVRPEEIEVEMRGSGNMEREVRPILMAEKPAERLLVVEVITPNGHWSSYPPHKHDRDEPPEETYLEETYYHRVKPEQGFAVQRGLHRGPFARRDDDRPRRRHRSRAGRLPRRLGASRLRPLLPERHGRTDTRVEVQ